MINDIDDILFGNDRDDEISDAVNFGEIFIGSLTKYRKVELKEAIYEIKNSNRLKNSGTALINISTFRNYRGSIFNFYAAIKKIEKTYNIDRKYINIIKKKKFDYEEFTNILEENINEYNLFLKKDLKKHYNFLFDYILIILASSIYNFKNTEKFSDLTPSPSPFPSPSPESEEKLMNDYLDFIENNLINLFLKFLSIENKNSDNYNNFKEMFYENMENLDEYIYDEILFRLNIPRNLFLIDDVQIYYFNIVDSKNALTRNHMIYMFKEFYDSISDKVKFYKLDPTEQFKKAFEYAELKYVNDNENKEEVKESVFKKYIIIIIVAIVILLLVFIYFMMGSKKNNNFDF